MYAADVIKSYERFADYIRQRLNALGYTNIIVVCISAITSVYIDKIRSLMPTDDNNNSLEKQLKNLRREYKGTEKATIISFIEKSLITISDFHGVEIKSLQELKLTSRVDYLIKVAELMYDPVEQFDWIDETFEDVFETDFENDEEFFKSVLSFAEKGDTDAMNFAGLLYNGGLGVEENKFAAFEWYRKAAELGNPIGMINLADSYRDGEGVAQNLQKAFEWYKKAAENEVKEAFEELGYLYQENEDYNQAFYWIKRAAENGNAYCMNRIGVMYSRGQGTFQNDMEATKWYRKAAEAGNAWGMYNLAGRYAKGIGGVSRKFGDAVFWYEKAWDAGNEEAQGCINELNSEHNSSSSSGGCFITTAVCDSLNKPDNCTELMTFRKFRDEWLINQPDGKDLITEYYLIAPKIVSKINESPDSKDIYNSIWKDFLLPCFKLIQYGENVSCKKKYIEMVHYLQKIYS